MKKLLFVFGLCALVFTGCKKSDDTATASSDFLILTAGSNFTYQSVSGSTTTVFKLTVKGTDSTINGKAYKVLTNSNGPNNYWLKSGTDYYRYGIFPGLTAAGGIEELYLKDGSSSWTNNSTISYMGSTYAVVGTYKITETGITKTVAGKTYTGVTHVTVALSTSISVVSLSLGSGDFYYAPGVGLINYTATVGNASVGIATSAQSSDLIAYEIK